jgi:hypothetical protein
MIRVGRGDSAEQALINNKRMIAKAEARPFFKNIIS